jgi:hypothetical protein
VLFWDTDASKFDVEKHAKYIIERVCSYGTWQDWTTLVKHYGIEKIKNELLHARYIAKQPSSQRTPPF